MGLFNQHYVNHITSSIFFIRLSKKTQMVPISIGEEREKNSINSQSYKEKYQNRLTHTLDVRMCAESIAKSLKPSIKIDDEVLVASALLHDVGHTPFGHAGEEAVNEMFLTNDGKHYSETYPGLFKHNINSLKIIGEHLDEYCKSFALMDGILKHTSPFPKKYCLSAFKEKNIIKSNFILRYFSRVAENNINDFVKILKETKTCEKKSARPVCDFNHCHICLDDDCSCGFCFNDVNPELRYSAYICFPYALTYEGAALYLADEISCFCSDLFDFFKYVSRNEQEIKAFMPLTKIMNSISIVTALFASNPLVSYLNEYKNEFNRLMNGQTVNDGRVNDIIIRIKKQLLSSVSANSGILNKNDVFVCFDGKRCKPLLYLSNSNDKIMKIIKKAIYQDMHSIDCIDSKNKEGKELLRKLITFYYKNFTRYLDDFKSKNNKSACPTIKGSIAAITKLPYDTINTWFDEKNGALSIESLLTEKNQTTNLDDLNDPTRIKLVKNLIKREIGYFVASLSEEDCFNIAKENSVL